MPLSLEKRRVDFEVVSKKDEIPEVSGLPEILIISKIVLVLNVHEEL